MSAIRTNNIYISSQLHRWLKWVAELDPNGTASADSVAEATLRLILLNQYPDIEQLESEYWTARNKLDKETVEKLKQKTKQGEQSENKKQSENMGRATDS